MSPKAASGDADVEEVEHGEVPMTYPPCQSSPEEQPSDEPTSSDASDGDASCSSAESPSFQDGFNQVSRLDEFNGAIPLAIAALLRKHNTEDGEKPLTPFNSVSVPAITLERYVRHIQKRCAVSDAALISSVIYIVQITSNPHSNIVLTPRTVHRLCLASILVAVKYCDDKYHTNSWFAKIGGVATAELNALELVFLDELKWATAVPVPAFWDIVHEMKLALEESRKASQQDVVTTTGPVARNVKSEPKTTSSATKESAKDLRSHKIAAKGPCGSVYASVYSLLLDCYQGFSAAAGLDGFAGLEASYALEIERAHVR